MRRLLTGLGLGIVGTAIFGACNIFISLDRCADDSDCPRGLACAPQHFCVKKGGSEANPVSDASDAASADVIGDEDVMPPPCNIAAPFGGPIPVAGLEGRGVYSARLTPKEDRVLLSAANGCPDETCADLMFADRSDPNDLHSAFGVPRPIPRVNADAAADYWPTLTADGRLLFFESSRSLTPPYTSQFSRIWTATRVNEVSEFGDPYITDTFTANAPEGSPYLHPSGRSLYFVSLARGGKGDLDVFVAKIDGDGFGSQVENLDAVNTPLEELGPIVTLDERTLYLARQAPSVRDIHVSSRSDTDASFGPATAVPELATTAYDEIPAWVSDDGCRLYFLSNQPLPGMDAASPDLHLWVTQRPQ